MRATKDSLAEGVSFVPAESRIDLSTAAIASVLGLVATWTMPRRQDGGHTAFSSNELDC